MFDFRQIDPTLDRPSPLQAAKSWVSEAEDALEAERLLYAYEPTTEGQGRIDAAQAELDEALKALEGERDAWVKDGLALADYFDERYDRMLEEKQK